MRAATGLEEGTGYMVRCLAGLVRMASITKGVHLLTRGP